MFYSFFEKYKGLILKIIYTFVILFLWELYNKCIYLIIFTGIYSIK